MDVRRIEISGKRFLVGPADTPSSEGASLQKTSNDSSGPIPHKKRAWGDFCRCPLLFSLLSK